MKRSIVFSALCLGYGVLAAPPTIPVQGGRITLSVREADLRDVLRAAAADTDLNLVFEPGIDTVVRGLDLKGATLEEILDQILPAQGLAYRKEGRTLHIHRSDAGMKFYRVDVLALRRSGTKSFQVNASGQIIQSNQGGGGGGDAASSSQGASGGSGGSSGSNGNSSAYTSSLNVGNASDPWKELELGLTTLIFGEPMESSGSASSESGGGPSAPSSRGFAKNGKHLVIHPDSGLIMVSADAATHRRVETYLSEMQRRINRQVQLEARIVEVSLGNDSQIGLDWAGLLKKGALGGGEGTDIASDFTSGATLNPNVQSGDGLFRLVVQNARVTATLSALAREGRLQVLSAPRISTLNNQKAILRVVREEAYFLQNSQVTPTGLGGAIATIQITPVVVPVGIVLDIQPQVGEDGTITLAVNPSVSEIVTVRNFSAGGSGGSGGASATLPVVDRRDLDTIVRIRSGETLVLAGIIRAKTSEDDRGVPWLRKLPLVGNLFTKREKAKSHTELAIFITPTLLEDGDQIQSQRAQTEERLNQAGADLRPEPRPVSSVQVP